MKDDYNEEDLLLEAFSDVEPLGDRERVPPPAPRPLTVEPYDEDRETLDQLEALANGDAPFDSFPHKEEYAQWAAADAPPDILPRLADGDFSFGRHLDLHGMTREEAKLVLERFLIENRARGESCVLVVHGRGKGSPNGQGVLRRAVHSWLRRGAIGRNVLAYTTARKVDGGSGATYVLLREEAT